MEIEVETAGREREVQQVLAEVALRMTEIWRASGHGRIEISLRDGQVQVVTSISTLVIPKGG